MTNSKASITFLLLLSLVGCNTVDTDFPIVLGGSIEGIEPGFSTTQVKERMGEPLNELLGDAAAFWYEYGNADGTSAPLRITFAEDYENRVVAIVARGPYAETTGEGIGIGSSKQDVRQVHGVPDASSVQLNWKGLGRPIREGDVYHGGQDKLASIVTYDVSELVASIELVLVTIE